MEYTICAFCGARFEKQGKRKYCPAPRDCARRAEMRRREIAKEEARQERTYRQYLQKKTGRRSDYRAETLRGAAKRENEVNCDKCGRPSTVAKTDPHATIGLINRGWSYLPKENIYICPLCSKECL